ncbi:MAG: Type I site-specific deoxyribonuclease, partial [uncultured bacterium (gcode 4)]
KERVDIHKNDIFQHYSDKRQEFLAFVLDHYIAEGVDELSQDKLPDLLELKYHSVGDAISELGAVSGIRDAFIGFQAHLYASE